MAKDFSNLPLEARVTPTTVRGSFVKRFWRGEISPAASLGLFGLLGCVVRVAAGLGIMIGLYVLFKPDHLQPLIVCLAAFAAFDSAVALWQLVGIWRSGVKARGGLVVVAVVMTILILLSSAVILANIGNGIRSVSSEMASQKWMQSHQPRR